MVVPLLKFSFYLALSVVAIALVLFILMNTWPICGYLAVTRVAAVVAQKRKGIWARASEKVLAPTAVALAVLFLVLLLFNVFKPSDDALAIGRIETWMLAGRDALRWTKLPWPVFAAVVLGLIGVSTVAPELRAVTTAASWKSRAAKASRFTAVLTSFTFFTSTGVVLPQSRHVDTRITALYARAHAERQQALARQLAYRSLELAISHMSHADRQYLGAAVVTVAGIPALSDDGRTILLHDLATRTMLLGDATSPAVPPAASASRSRTLEELSIERGYEIRARLVAEQAKKGVQALLSETLDLGLGRASDLAATYLSFAVDVNSGFFLDMARSYLDKGAAVSLDPAGESIARRVADRFARRWSALHATRPLTPQAAATSDVNDALADLYRRSVAEATSAEGAAEKAAAESKAALASKNYALAEQRADEAVRLAAEAQRVSGFAETAKPGVVEAARHTGDVARIAEAARDASLAADGARIAAEAVNAARAAEAARAAAQAAHAAPLIDVLRVLK